MKYAIAALTLMFGGMNGALAQNAPVADPTGVILNMNFESIRPVLEEVGFEVQDEVVGQINALAVTYDGKKAFLQPTACNSGDCLGLVMTALLTPTNTPTQDQVTAFNVNLNAGNAVLSDGQLYLKNYVVADYGVTRGSFVIDVAVFISLIDNWFEMYPSEN